MPSEIIDFHARLAPRPGMATRLLTAMAELGVARAVVSAGGLSTLAEMSRLAVHGGRSDITVDNRATLAATAGHPEVLLPLWFADPGAGVAGYRRHGGSFVGLEISPTTHGVDLDEDLTREWVEAAAGHGHSVYVVCLGRRGSRAEDLADLAGRHPEVTFVLGHCGFVGIDVHAVECVADLPNVVAETSGCYGMVVAEALRLLGPERLLFGTEFPLQHPGTELHKIRALGLPRHVEDLVLGGNAGRFLQRQEAA